MKPLRFFMAAIFTMILAGAGPAPRADSLQGWSNDQLKEEIYRLRRDIQDLRKKLGFSDMVEIKDKNSVKIPKDSWKLDDFENPSSTSGIGGWSVEFDHNNMGTTLFPNPFQRLAGGSPLSPGFCAGMKGHFGPSEAPWTWAYLQTNLNSQGTTVDLNGYKELWFTARGDGKYYITTLRRAVVQDYCDFQSDFTAPEKWTLIKLPLDHFNQPTWGVQYPRAFPDVKNMAFSPELHEADYDLKVDDIVFVK